MAEQDPANTGGGEGGGEGAGETRKWLSSIPENLRGHEAFKDVKELPEVYQRFADLTVKSRDMVAIPNDKATPEELAAFQTRLGRPESADKYVLTKPENLPEHIPYTPEMEAFFKENIAFKHGLSAKSADGLWKDYYNMVIKADSAAQQEYEKGIETSLNALKDEWKGEEFDKNKEIAIRAFKSFGKGFETLLDEKIGTIKLGDHPAFIKLFNAIGKSISDDSAHSDRTGSTGELSEEAKAKARFPATYPQG